MDLAFYNEIGGHSAAGLLVRPARRIRRRLLRPTYQRLRDLLQLLFDRQNENRARIEELEGTVASLQSQIAAYRPLVADYIGVTRRLAVLEDQLLRTLAEPRPVTLRAAA